MNDKIIDEYVNFMGVFNKLNNIYFINDKKIRRDIYKSLQHLIEDRILYRYKIKSPPYHGYNIIKDDEEIKIIDDFFDDTKKYLEKKNKKNEMYNKLYDIKKYFIDNVNNKKHLFSDMYSDEDNIIKVTPEYIKYRKVKIILDERLKYLLQKMGEKKFLRMILRYIGYGITGQHCSIPYHVYKYMYDVFNIRGEGFSSPLNSKLLGFKDTIFCTLFKDTDKKMGSVGPFSSKILIKNSDKNWAVNPPYMKNIMYIAYKVIMKVFKKIERNDFLVIYFMPKWIDDKTYNKLKKCKYLVKMIEPDEGKHYMNCNGRLVYMKGVVISTFFLCRDKNIVTEEKINKLLELWNTHIDDDKNQSFFTFPEII